jgi:hypothetical protein
MHKEMKSSVRKILLMKGRRKDAREIWVEPENQDEYKYRHRKMFSRG